MTSNSVVRALCAAILALTFACGGAQTTPNDEVTTPLDAEDQAALESQPPAKQEDAAATEEEDGEATDTSEVTP